MYQYLLIAVGTLSLSIGIIGIYVPGLPTTPFLLLTAAMYLKGSPSLYKKLQNHKITGKYLNKINNGISLRTRLISILLMWTMILITVIWVIESLKWKLFLIIVGIIGTVVKLSFSPNKPNRKNY